MLTLVTAEPEHSLEELPGRPWAVRRAAGPAGRPALEIYVADVFVDLLVLPADWPLAPHIVRGACSATWAGQSYVAAWGILPPAGRGLLVQFRLGRIHPEAWPADLAPPTDHADSSRNPWRFGTWMRSIRFCSRCPKRPDRVQ